MSVQEETLLARIERFRTTTLEPENDNDHRLMLHWEQNAIRSKINLILICLQTLITYIDKTVLDRRSQMSNRQQ